MLLRSDIPDSTVEVSSLQLQAPSRGGGIAGQLLLLILAILMCIGIVVVYSSGAGWARSMYSSTEYFLWRHLIFILLSLAVIALFGRLDYHFFWKTSRLIFLASIALLSMLLIMKGLHIISGAARWIGFGSFKFQVSDLAKYAIIFHLSRLITEKQSYIMDL